MSAHAILFTKKIIIDKHKSVSGNKNRAIHEKESLTDKNEGDIRFRTDLPLFPLS